MNCNQTKKNENELKRKSLDNIKKDGSEQNSKKKDLDKAESEANRLEILSLKAVTKKENELVWLKLDQLQKTIDAINIFENETILRARRKCVLNHVLLLIELTETKLTAKESGEKVVNESESIADDESIKSTSIEEAGNVKKKDMDTAESEANQLEILSLNAATKKENEFVLLKLDQLQKKIDAINIDKNEISLRKRRKNVLNYVLVLIELTETNLNANEINEKAVEEDERNAEVNIQENTEKYSEENALKQLTSLEKNMKIILEKTNENKLPWTENLAVLDDVRKMLEQLECMNKESKRVEVVAGNLKNNLYCLLEKMDEHFKEIETLHKREKNKSKELQCGCPGVIKHTDPNKCENKEKYQIKETIEVSETDEASETEEASETDELQEPLIEFVNVKKRTKGKETLHAIINKVKFYCNKTDKRTGKKFFRCSYYDSLQCRASFSAIKYEGEWQAENLLKATWHHHENASDENLIEKAKASLRTEVITSSFDKKRKPIYYDWYEKYSSQLSSEENKIFEKKFPTYKSIKQTMWRWQKEILPKAPANQAQLDTSLEYFFSKEGEHLVIGDTVDEHGNRTLTFGDPTTLHLFRESSRLNIDCTYKSAPLPDWASLLIIQARVENYWAPLTYTILPNESAETLKIAFQQVRNAVESKGKGFSRNCEVMFDYDGNLREVYKQEIGDDYNHKIRGCSFHFGQCICEYVNGNKMMSKYQNKKNQVLRDTIQAALGIPYLREEDLEHVQEDLHSIFYHIEFEDPGTFQFCSRFADEYIAGYWLKSWEKSEICFWGDLSNFSSEHMTNNALESHNNQFYTSLGREAHPNPYYFVIKLRNVLKVTKRILKQVEDDVYLESKSKNAKMATEKRHRLKLKYVTRLERAETEEEEQMARIKYMIGTGSTFTRILAKGRKKAAKKRTSLASQDEPAMKAMRGRPLYIRKRAPQQKKCRFCGKIYQSKSGCTNHEKSCDKRINGKTGRNKNKETPDEQIEDMEIKQDSSKPNRKTFKCSNCEKIYVSKKWFIKHEEKCTNERISEREINEDEDLEDIQDSSANDDTNYSSTDEDEELDDTKDSIISSSFDDSMKSSSNLDYSSIENEETHINFNSIIEQIRNEHSEKRLLKYLKDLEDSELTAESIMECTDARLVLQKLGGAAGQVGRTARLLLLSWTIIVREHIMEMKLTDHIFMLSDAKCEDDKIECLQSLLQMEVSLKHTKNPPCVAL